MCKGLGLAVGHKGGDCLVAYSTVSAFLKNPLSPGVSYYGGLLF